jgi:hypothetical protein
LAVLASIGTESENAVSAFLHFQCLGGTENGRAHPGRRETPNISAFPEGAASTVDWRSPARRLDGAELANKASAPA